ncbi:hypothetical protein MNBD_GAMMA01-1900 [hydrothermal vent metagenome]|uniref:Acyltransferase 3 domain-containing protein n=1 Tax=hydrothermal vent metagenome TaxID=652676 RepID=A0A3B0VC21_9ZZZZ
MTNKQPSRFAAIDALRGIAALMVVWQHTSESFVKLAGVAEHGTFLATISQELDFGRIGIICFFLISGFVIPSSLTATKNNVIGSFVIRRFFRLYPAYWLSLLLVVALAFVSGIETNGKTILANTTMLQSFFAQPHLIGLYWTLQVELIFYCLCALLFYFGLLQNNRFVFMLIVVSFTLFALPQTLTAVTDLQLEINKEFQLLPYLLSIMFLGSFYRKIYDNKDTDRELFGYTVIATLLCLGLPLLLLIGSLSGFTMVSGSFRFGIAHSLAFGLFFAGLIFLKNVGKPLLWLGTISYSLYLLHPLVMQVLIKTVNNFKPLQELQLWIYMSVTTIFSIIIASLAYKLVEKPAINLGYRLDGHKKTR